MFTAPASSPPKGFAAQSRLFAEMHVAIMDEAHGTLVSPESIKNEGRVMVTVKSEEDLSRFHILPGSIGNVGIYSRHVGQNRRLQFPVYK